MMRNVLISAVALTLMVHGVAPSTAAVSGDALDADLAEEARPAGLPTAPSEPVTTVRVVAPPAPPARTPSANPLWAVPLTQLSGTRDRPIFSPSRRPPPPAAAAAAEAAPVRPPPRKKEIEPPPLALVGTIAGGEEGFGIFLDQSTKAALRLKIGDDYQGWKLRAIQGREVTMEKDERAAVLSMPQPGAGPSGEAHLLPVNAVTTPVAARR